MRTVLVTGCNRGIGLGLVRQLLKADNPPETVIATCRSAAKAENLRQIAEENDRVKILEFDVTNFEDYNQFSSKVSDIVKDRGLNVLINNAGISQKFTRIQFVKPEQMMDNFKVNTVAPVILTKTLLPFLSQASKNNSDRPLGSARALVINTSSILGSIAGNTDGGFYPYRCSKAALNMATKSMSVDLAKEGIIVTCLHPGWVKTDMGGSNAPLDVETSTSGIVKAIRTFSESHNGGFYQYDGKQIAW